MKSFFRFVGCGILLLSTTLFAASNREAVDYVNPLIGSAFTGFDKGLEGGGTMP